MVLYQVSRQVEVDVNLSVDYSLETNLTEGAISSETANVTASVEAYKCTTDFTVDNQALRPGAELHVCIKPEDPDIQVETIASMVRL